MNSCEYIYIISSIAYTISQGKDIDEITETLNKKNE